VAADEQTPPETPTPAARAKPVLTRIK